MKYLITPFWIIFIYLFANVIAIVWGILMLIWTFKPHWEIITFDNMTFKGETYAIKMIGLNFVDLLK